AVDVPRLVLHFDSAGSWSSRARARGSATELGDYVVVEPEPEIHAPLQLL
ncbi:Os01g0670500, partial [Oryza sativa Japonica Group]